MKEIGIVLAIVVLFLAFSSFADRQADRDQEERDEHEDP
jgi:hypothetical protein